MHLDARSLGLRCGLLARGLTLALLCILPLAFGGVRPLEFALAQGLVAAALLAWAAQFLLAPEDAPRFVTPLGWALLGLLLLVTVRYFTADVAYVARMEWVRGLLVAGVFFLVLNQFCDGDAARQLVAALLVTGCAISLYGVWQWATGATTVWTMPRPVQYAGRASGTFINPNHFAGLLEMLCALALCVTMLGRLKTVPRVLHGYAAFLLVVGISLSASRGGILSLAVTLLLLAILLLTASEYRRLALGLLLVLLVFGGALSANRALTGKRFDQLFHSGGVHDIRKDLWTPARSMIAAHPAWGVGPGHYDIRFREFRPPSIQRRPEHAHNDLLEFTAEYGFIGAAAFALVGATGLWTFFSTWVQLRRANRRARYPVGNKIALLVGSALAVVVISLHAAVEFHFRIPANALLALACLGLLAAVGVRVRNGRDPQPPLAWRRWIWVPGLVVAAAILLAHGVRLGREALALSTASGAAGTEKRAALEQAWNIERSNSSTAQALGDWHRQEGWEDPMHQVLHLTNAIAWYQKASRLQPYDPYPWIGQGLCHSWMDEPTEAASAFGRAYQLDPHNYVVVARQGWQAMQVKDWPAAAGWFRKSLQLQGLPVNTFAAGMLTVAEQRMREPERRLKLPRIPSE